MADDLGRFVGATLAIDVEPHVEYASADTIRHFAWSTGDDNPLFCDSAYAKTSVLGGIVAPPLFPIATGTPDAASREPLPTALHAAFDMLQGVPFEVLEDRWQLDRRIHLGQRLERSDTLADVHVDETGSLVVTTRSRYHESGVTYADHLRSRVYGRETPIRAPREQAARYTADDLAAIDRCYENETRRGAATRHADEVTAGHAVGPVVRGPLTATDLIEYRAGAGRGPYGAGALRLAYLNRAQRPNFYDLDIHGARDARERCHWDGIYAASLGHPHAYDYTHTRVAWLGHVLTDWLGDGGWLSSLRVELLANNYVGDTQWITGEVRSVDRNAGDQWGVAHVALRMTNQLDMITCVATAEVLLPVRPHGCVELPVVRASTL
jgi:acyl dehydratase